MPTVSRPVRLALPLLPLLLLAGHLWFWYLPRERPARFGDSALARQLIADEGLSTALWVPYPHQNLAMLARATGDRQEYLAALFRLLDAAPPNLPGFGPLALPPARELVVGVDAGGDRFVVAADVYPVVACFARLAGLVAGNPWLSGGSVEMGRRQATVSWVGRRWVVATGESSPAAGPASPSVADATRRESPGNRSTASLAVLRALEPPAPFPAGLYHLSRHGDSLEITSGSAVATDPFSAAVSSPEVEGLWVLERWPTAGEAGDDEIGAVPTARALAVTLGELTSTIGLPEIVTLSRGAVPDWGLPGVDLLRSLTGGGAQRRVGEWRFESFSEQGLDRVAPLLPSFDRLLGGSAGSRLQVAGALDLDAERRLVAGLIGLADGFPLVPERYRRFLHDVQTLGRPLEGFDEATLVIQQRPGALRLRLRKR